MNVGKILWSLEKKSKLGIFWEKSKKKRKRRYGKYGISREREEKGEMEWRKNIEIRECRE